VDTTDAVIILAVVAGGYWLYTRTSAAPAPSTGLLGQLGADLSALFSGPSPAQQAAAGALAGGQPDTSSGVWSEIAGSLGGFNGSGPF
jgi:hypothetical protein